MFHLLVASALISVAMSSKCCSPGQWEGGIREISGSVVSGKTHVIAGNLSMSYDYTNTKLAVTSNLLFDDKPRLTTLIYNYQTKTVYSIIGRTCQVLQLLGTMQQICVPDNAIPTGKFTYGIGADVLDAMGYMINMDSNTTVYATTTFGNPCMPLGEIVYGTPSENPTMMSMSYYNISLGIANPNVFTPPSFCKGQKMLKSAPEMNSKLMKHIHYKFTKN